MIPASLKEWTETLEITFDEVVALIHRLGGTSSYSGAILKCSLAGRWLFLQRPDDRPLLKHYQTQALRDFLELTGVLT